MSAPRRIEADSTLEREQRSRWSRTREERRLERMAADPAYAERRQQQVRAAWSRQPDDVRRETRRGATTLTPANEAMRAAVASHIRAVRTRRGWSMRQCGARSRMDRAVWGRLESGKHALSLQVLQRVADALLIDVRELVAIGAVAWRRSL